MAIIKTNIEGLYVMDGFVFHDLRGSLIKPFSQTFFKDFEQPINLDFKETWFTKSHKDVIRAIHLQVGEFACEKLVSVIQGAVLDVILDLREDSATYGDVFHCELNSTTPKVLYIPKGCAHGYKVLEDNTITLYMGTEVNVPKDDVGIHWNSFGFDWGVENPIVSKKDMELPSFEKVKI